MKKLIFIVIFAFVFSATIFAQSGRKVRPVTPTPTPTPAEDETGISDSVPVKTRMPKTLPNLRGGANSQTPANPNSTTAPSTDTSASSNDDVLHVETTLVAIPVSVTDRSTGAYIPNLQKSDFKIFESGKEQEIAYFGTTEQPFTVVLLLDVSPSTRFKIDEIQQAAITFVNQLKPQDSVIVIDFDERVRVLTEATTDREKISKAIRRTGFGEGTSLYEAVDLTIRKYLDTISGRKAVVLFTDGVDTTSRRATYYSTISEAEETDALFFPVYFNTLMDSGNNGGVMSSPYPPMGRFPSPNGGNFPFPGGGGQRQPRGGSSQDYALGKRYLDDLAAKTGGRLFPADYSGGGLEGAFAGIAEALRSQYSIGYYPSETAQKGLRQQIKVRVNRPNLVVKARDSYVVGTTDAVPKTANNTPAKSPLVSPQ